MGHFKGIPNMSKTETNTDKMHIFSEGNVLCIYNVINYRHMKVSYAINNFLICYSWKIKKLQTTMCYSHKNNWV